MRGGAEGEEGLKGVFARWGEKRNLEAGKMLSSAGFSKKVLWSLGCR